VCELKPLSFMLLLQLLEETEVSAILVPKVGGDLFVKRYTSQLYK